ncbi:hypothetical protein [Gaetbulibacter jejuensis]|uniref:hypothetical protein n=1 Tax=Gaetbulibacter jejuensis TaxID=584607 RepID=UPI0030080176
MKKILLLIATVILFNCTNDDSDSIDTNNSIEMVSEFNKWYHRGEYEYFNGATATIESTKIYLTYFFDGDTLINNVEYKKMYTNQLDSIFHLPSSSSAYQFISTSTSLNYRCAMRQDASMVYFVNKNQNNEELYADFNITLGDVLNYKWSSNNEVVTEIDSIPIGSSYLKKYKLSNNQYFYEAIGGSYGLFKDWSIGFEGGHYLNCFRHSNDKISVDESLSPTNNYCPEY